MRGFFKNSGEKPLKTSFTTNMEILEIAKWSIDTLQKI